MASSDFMQTTAALEDLLAASPRMPVTELALVREQDLVQLLARLRSGLPASAVKLEEWRQELDAIRTRARDEADDILQRAHDEVERLVHDPHLQRDARQRAEEVLREAETKAVSIRAAADAFFTSTLSTFAEHLMDLDTVLERNILALRQGTEALRVRTEAARASGKLPLHPDRPLFTPGPIQVEYHEPADRAAATPEPGSGPTAPTPDSPLA